MRKRWVVYGTQVYYTSSALYHCRYYVVCICETLAKQIVDTITFLLYNIEMPHVISVEVSLDWIIDLIKLLKGSKPHLLHEKY